MHGRRPGERRGVRVCGGVQQHGGPCEPAVCAVSGGVSDVGGCGHGARPTPNTLRHRDSEVRALSVLLPPPPAMLPVGVLF
jgi:hypothetical protein